MCQINSAENGVANNVRTVTVEGRYYQVPDHGFWDRFESWEPETRKIFRQIVKGGDTVLDIGAWIGPTVLFALSAGADRVIAVEPNPASRAMLERLINLNPGMGKKVTVVPMAVCNGPSHLHLGQPQGDSDSSLFGIGGRDIVVDCLSIIDLIERQGLKEISLIKIDVEGSEILLAEDFHQLGKRPGQNIHLSIHRPFWPRDSHPEALANALAGYEIWDDRGQALTQADLHRRLVTTRSRPDWGTRHGNFFELRLRAR